MSVLVAHYVTMIDHESAVPVYRQVAAILRDRIGSGEYAPGRRLPSVRGLVQEFGIAELTARKALRVLVDEGVAEMTPGMGTFVTGQPGRELSASSRHDRGRGNARVSRKRQIPQ